MKRTPDRNLLQFTLIELLVVVAIIAILAAMLMPALTTARERGRRAVCTGNLRQVTIGIVSYADDWDGNFLVRQGWTPEHVHETGVDVRPQLLEYWGSSRIFYCPSGGRDLWLTVEDPSDDQTFYYHTDSGRTFIDYYLFAGYDGWTGRTYEHPDGSSYEFPCKMRDVASEDVPFAIDYTLSYPSVGYGTSYQAYDATHESGFNGCYGVNVAYSDGRVDWHGRATVAYRIVRYAGATPSYIFW